MNRCVECNSVVTWNVRSHICEDCYDEKMKLNIMNEDRVVESPHASWF